MELTHEDIESFIEMWNQEFGETLTYNQAQTEATRLLTFFMLLAEARIDLQGTLPGVSSDHQSFESLPRSMQDQLLPQWKGF